MVHGSLHIGTWSFRSYMLLYMKRLNLNNMKMKNQTRLSLVRAILLVAFSLTVIPAVGQPTGPSGEGEPRKLINNGSFEQIDSLLLHGYFSCPSSGGQIQIADGWAPAYGTVDYYNTCSNNTYPNYGVPQNLLGIQSPRTGDAYGSLISYVDFWPNTREYLWRKLESPLVADQRYYMEYYVSLSDSSNFAVSTLGAFFSTFDTRYLSAQDFLTLEPQVEDTSEGHPFWDKDEWMKVSGTFTASGGEQYVTIGKFRHDFEDLDIERVSIYNPDRWDGAMYLIDDVSLTPVSEVGIDEEVKVETIIYPNPSLGESITLKYSTHQGNALVWEITDMFGKVVHSQPLKGREGKTTLNQKLPDGNYVSTIIVDGTWSSSTKFVVSSSFKSLH
ncbi:MAG: T9SS type A sorting domain-containing protein [Flavobacteriales bacterium]|nr:T9SS type A sorting domain-containing protein [Flavobacteriales bacterium]